MTNNRFHRTANIWLSWYIFHMWWLQISPLS